MPHQERALLDAIIAEPADDTVRLVYSDWLNDHDQPARGEFIRVQIEAERPHADFARRAKPGQTVRPLTVAILQRTNGRGSG